MPISQYDADNFLAGAKRTLPRGRAWPRGLASILSQTLAPFMLAAARVGKGAASLPLNTFPQTTIDMLPEWEKSLGLPDPCAGESPTVEQRRNQVVARLTDSGGSSITYFTEFAAALGYTIEIEEYAPARAGLLRAGDPVYGEDWAYAWLVKSPGFSPVYFRAGLSAAGEPLMAWGNEVLRCEISARNPAHLIVNFGQTGENLIGDFGLDIL